MTHTCLFKGFPNILYIPPPIRDPERLWLDFFGVAAIYLVVTGGNLLAILYTEEVFLQGHEPDQALGYICNLLSPFWMRS